MTQPENNYTFEWRLTYDSPYEGLTREGFGLDEKGARRRAAEYREAGIGDVRLWRRPKPDSWQEVSQ